MKILIVIPQITSYETFLRETVEELLNRGFNILVCLRKEHLKGIDCYKESDRVKFIHIPIPRGANLFLHLLSSFILLRIIKKEKPDLVHAHFSSAMFTVAISKLFTKVKALATIQGLISSTMNSSYLSSKAELMSARILNRVYVLSKDDLDFLEKKHFKNAYLQEGFGFGCDLTKFDPNLFSFADKIEIKRQLGIPLTSKVVTFIGRQTSFKGFGILVKSFLNILEQRRDIIFMFVGIRDPLHPMGCTDREIFKCRNSPNSLFIGWVPDVNRYLSITDVLAFPSVREGMPVNLMEAVSMGIPIVTCDVRGCKELVRHNVNGILMKSQNVDILSYSIIKLIDDDNLRESCRKEALIFREELDRCKYIENQLKVYCEMSCESN